MNRVLYSLLLSLSSIFVLQAQVIIGFGTDTISSPGGTVDIDVVVQDGWDDIVGMQFSINWDRTVFSYSSIQNITTEISQFSDGNIGVPPTSPGVEDGELTISWSGPNTQPVSVPDGTVLFTLRLFGDGELCQGTTLEITDTPLQREVFDTNFDFIDIEARGGEIAIADASCDMTGGGGDGVGLNFSDVRAPENTMICIPVTTANFDDIGSVQGGITWDPTVLRYVELMDAGLTSVSANVSNADQGEMSILWLFDQEGVTLADGATLFELCFEVIGSTGATTNIGFGDTPVQIEVAGVNGSARDVDAAQATFTVGSDDVEEVGVGLIVPDVFTNNQSNICVPVTTREFTNIAALQGGITFDPAVLTFTGVNGAGLPVSVSDFITGQADEGDLGLLFTIGLTDDPVTVEDGGVLFELCFDVIGSEGESSALTFVNREFLPLEVVSEDAEPLDFFVRDGSVTIGVDDTEPDLVITASNEAGQTNDTVCVQFTTERFTNIEGMAWAIEWDADVARYINQQGFNLNGVSNNIFNFESPDKLSLLYAPTSPQSAPDGTSIFEVCFEILADCGEGISTPITFVPGATPIEFVGANQQTLTADLVNGSVTADTCLGKAVDVLSITQPSCSGDSDGAVTVEFKNTIGAVMCEWVDENGAVVSTNCNLVGVAGGMYTLTGTDEEDSIIVRTVEVRDPGEITTSPAVTDESCIDGGSIMLNVSGGTSPYSFSWTGGLGDSENLTDVVAGDYEVTITDDNSCTATAMVTVGAGKFELDPLVTPAMGSMLGSIDLRPAAAVDASYSWSNGDTGSSITDLVPDTYMVTISDNNSDCEEVRSFDVEGDVELAIGDLLDEINATYNGFGVSCNGESDGILDGMITGGCSDGPVRVFINNTEVMLPAMGLPAGTHVLRLEDACGATVEQEFMITEPDAITVGPVTDVTCPTDGMSDGSFRLPTSGGVGDLSIMTAVGTVGMDGLISGVDDRPFNVIVTDDNNCQLMVEDTGLAGECGPAIFECEGSSFISPNGDGLNDRFEIPCTRFVTPNELTIYTRWGETIFEVQNYDNNWDGVDMSGADLPEGGYMWVLVTGTLGSREVTRGTVSILR